MRRRQWQPTPVLLPGCIYISFSLSLHLSMDTQVVPMSGYCEWCCCERMGACTVLNYGFLWIYDQEWDCRITWQLYFQFFQEPPCCFPSWLLHFTFLPTMQRAVPISSNPLQHLLFVFFNDGHSTILEKAIKLFLNRNRINLF